MTHEKAVSRLRAIRVDGYDSGPPCNTAMEISERRVNDPEKSHVQADGILMQFLEQNGFNDIAAAWRAIQPKWYG